MIGTAVDYVMRALLTRKVGGAHSIRPTYVAELGLRRFPDALARTTISMEAESLEPERVEGLRQTRKHSQEIMDYLAARLQTAIQSVETFIDGHATVQTIAADALFMARLDLVYRAWSIHVADYYFEDVQQRTFFRASNTQPNDAIEENIAALASIFASEIALIPMTAVQCNPSFGRYSAAVGGADGDFIIDRTLIDVKTASKLGYQTEMMAQILAYAAMAQALDIPVERAGIYFARFGVWTILPLSALQRGWLDEYLAEIMSVV